jgi:ribosome-binding factor A
MPDRRPDPRRYPRTARVNEVVREIVADELERIDDERLELLTVTAVTVEPDLRHATVWFSSLPDGAANALAEARVRLQGAIARQVRLKRTPELAFRPDPAIATGERVDDILRALSRKEGGQQS